MSTGIILVRHATSAPDAARPEWQWPLSVAGQTEAKTLSDAILESTAAAPISRVISSPFVRAIDTVTPLSRRLGHEIMIRDDLRERRLAGAMINDWRDQILKTWQDFDYALPGGESSRQCQTRMVACMQAIATGSGTAVVCSHGNAIALFLNSIDPNFGFSEWETMGNPHVYRLGYLDGRWSLGAG